ncbi:hypothetical protein ACSFE6_30220, partial [Pseudomonas baetica]
PDMNPILVGASWLAMDENDDAGNLTPRSGLRFIASKLAPTGGRSPSNVFNRNNSIQVIP